VASTRGHGVWGALSQIPVNASRALRAWSPKRRRARREDLAFDRRHGIDTATPTAVAALGVAGDSAGHAVEYKPSGIAFVRAALGRLDIAHAQYSFVDLGSGKGRALLLASHLPFRRIIGVEFSPKLDGDRPGEHRRLSTSRSGCRQIEAVCADAARSPCPTAAGDLSLQRLRRRHPRAGGAQTSPPISTARPGTCCCSTSIRCTGRSSTGWTRCRPRPRPAGSSSIGAAPGPAKLGDARARHPSRPARRRRRDRASDRRRLWPLRRAHGPEAGPDAGRLSGAGRRGNDLGHRRRRRLHGVLVLLDETRHLLLDNIAVRRLSGRGIGRI